jgi:hypothetical protein
MCCDERDALFREIKQDFILFLCLSQGHPLNSSAALAAAPSDTT